MKTQEEIEQSMSLVRGALTKRAPRVVIAFLITFAIACGCLIYNYRSDRNYQRMVQNYTAEKLKTEGAILQQKDNARRCAQELALVLTEVQECALNKTGTN